MKQFWLHFMNSLTALYDCGLIDKDGFPILTKGEHFEKRKAIIFQKYAENDAHYDVTVSWLQKAIRRGKIIDALHCATTIAGMGGIFLSHLLNRLMIISSEDVGAAEPGISVLALQTYKTVWENRNDELCVKNKNAILRLVTALAKSRHSRYVDELIHWVELGQVELGKNDLQSFQKLVQKGHVEQAVAIALEIHHEKEKSNLGKGRKKLLVFQYFSQMRSFFKRNIDLQALYELYSKRKDPLHLVHAIVLACRKVTCKVELQTDLPKNKWEYYKNKKIAILNDAVDKHTQVGRNKVGRQMVAFWSEGAKTVRTVNFGRSREYREFFIQYYREIEGYNRYKVLEAREYQQEIVDAAIEHYRLQQKGRLEMACGAGKSFTTFLIQRELGVKTALVIVPRLMILSGYYECWRDQFIAMEGEYRRIGIVASDLANTVRNDFCSHDILDTDDKIVQYLEQGRKTTKTRILFATYASINKIIQAANSIDWKFQFTVCDEAHHLKIELTQQLVAMSDKILFQTATETKAIIDNEELYGEKIATYNFRQAINDGYLVDYNPLYVEVDAVAGAEGQTEDVNPGYHHIDAINDALEVADKLIVFSRNNQISSSLYAQFMAKYPSTAATYIDSTIKMSERQILLDQFRQSDKCVFFNCGILGEGVDIPECDAVYFTYPKVSYVDAVQSVGRCLRLDPKNASKFAHVYFAYANIGQYGKYQKMLERLSKVDPEVLDNVFD